LFSLKDDDVCFSSFDDYLTSYSNPMFIKAELKYGGHHSLYKCAVCHHNKRIRRVSHSDFDRRFVRRVSSKLQLLTQPLPVYDPVGSYLLFCSKESYGWSLAGVANMQILRSVVGSCAAGQSVHGKVCACFYGNINTEHVCTVNSLIRGVRYSIEVIDGVSLILHDSRVVARVYPCQVIDVSIKGVSGLLSDYFGRVVTSEPMEVAFSNNIAQLLRDGAFVSLFNCDPCLIPELISIVVRVFMSNSNLSCDVVDALTVLLREEVVVPSRYVNFVRRFLVGVVVVASSVIDYMNGVNISFSSSSYFYCVPVVLMMLFAGSAEMNATIISHVCVVLKISEFSFSEFLSWVKDLNLV